MQTIQRYLRQYRDEIKGFAILWVVFFHAQLGLEGLLYDVQRIGYGGVDIFFFLSGFGLYHSLQKNSSLKGYFVRRAKRLLPSYWPFCIIWLAVMIPLTWKGIRGAAHMALGNLLMFGYWTGASFTINWYVSAMAASLVLAPLLVRMIKEGKHIWLRTLLILAGAVGVGLLFVGNAKYMAISRLPVMILGMIFARKVSEERKLRWFPAFLALTALAGTALLFICLERFEDQLILYGLYWHPFVLITPGLCVGLGWIAAKVPAFISARLKILGKASFEIFLFNVWIELLGKRFGLADGPVSWLAWSMASIVAGILYYLTISRTRLKRNRLCLEKSSQKG